MSTTYTPVHHVLPATIAPAAVEAIRAASMRHGAHLEVAFRCSWDDASQQVTSAVPTFRGGPASTRFLPSQHLYGDLHLHTHPLGFSVEPSEPDLDCAAAAAACGVGYAICDPFGGKLFLVTSPADVAFRALQSDTANAWLAAVKRWRIGRLSIEWNPPYPVR